MSSKCCNDKGWVQSGSSNPVLCPVCKGASAGRTSTPAEDKYDQSATWIELKQNDFPESVFNKISIDVESVFEKLNPPESSCIIVHLLFDRIVTPEGNLIYDLMRAPHGQKKLTADELKSKRYVVTSDGDVYTVNDIPIAPVYNVIGDWYFKYSSFNKPFFCKLVIDPSRKGNPYFMDDDMVAFGVYVDTTSTLAKQQEFVEAFGDLVDTLERGKESVGGIVNFQLKVA